MGTAEPSGAPAVALAFTSAVARRDWRAVADALHPDALRAVRPSALDLLRLDGGTVLVGDGAQERSFVAADVLGVQVQTQEVAGLGDRDLGVLYLAGLDVLGVWGAPAPPRDVVGEVRDGDRVHVLMRSRDVPPGVSEVAVVTLARDETGVWRPLLTQPQGF